MLQAALVLLLAVCADAQGALLAEEYAIAPNPGDELAQQRLLALEADLDGKLLGASDPTSLWLRGLRTPEDLDARTRDLAAAHKTEPHELVFLAALVTACRENRVPRPQACAESDWLAKWASVDPDNAAPWVLLAERAARMGQAERAAASLDQAAGRTRYDEYWSKSGVRLWSLLDRRAESGSPGAEPIGALLLAVWGTQRLAATAAVSALCLREELGSTSATRAACMRVATSALARADTIFARRTGEDMVEHLAQDADSRTKARTALASLTEQGARCREWLKVNARQEIAGAPEERRVARGRLEQWIAELGARGELIACERTAPMR